MTCVCVLVYADVARVATAIKYAHTDTCERFLLKFMSALEVNTTARELLRSRQVGGILLIFHMHTRHVSVCFHIQI
jgi:hypothetical protein